MSSPFSLRQGKSGFTLIELLTVMAIIAILVGLLFPVVNSVMNSSRKTQASADETRIMTAVEAYKTDYGRLPLNSDQLGGASVVGGNTPKDTVYGNPGPGNTYPSYMLFDILRAIPETSANDPSGKQYNLNNQLNVRQVVYFQAPNVKNPNNPRNGFLLSSYNSKQYTIAPGSLVDPWGGEYIVWLDANADGDLNYMVCQIYSGYTQNQGPSGDVQVASMGPDGTLGTNGNGKPAGSDDVLSW